MAKTLKELEQELKEANEAREAAEKRAEEAERKASEEISAIKETEEELKKKNEELLKKAEEAEKSAMKEAENFFKKENATGPEHEKVRYKFPELRGKDADPDIVILVNGREWQIRRGVYVEIPKYVLDAYLCSEKAEKESNDFIKEVAN